MCYDDGQLMAYLDGEADSATRAEIAEHVSACDECRGSLERLAEQRTFAASKLEALEPLAEVTPLPAPSRGEHSVRPARRAGFSLKPGQIAALAAAVLAIGLLGFAPVRSAVASALQIFRVQKLQTVTVTQDDLSSVASALKKGGHVDLKSFGDVWVEGSRVGPTRVTLAEAQAAVDFPVKLPASETATPMLLLTRGQTYKFKLHVAAINAALEQYGAETLLPSSIDGKVFSIQVSPVLLAQYPAPAGSVPRRESKTDGVFVGQGHSPQLVVPDGVDAAQLRQVLIDLPFLPDSVRQQVASVQDWQSTLLVPNVDGTAHDLTIDGVPAVAISPASAARNMRRKVTGAAVPPIGDNTTVLWNDNGTVRAVGGPIDEASAVSIAKSMMR